MRKLGFIFVLLISFAASAETLPKVDLHWKSKCEKTNPGDWATAYASCSKSFKKADLSFAISDKICHCVADEYIQKPSCETLSKMNKSVEFRKVQKAKIAKACRPNQEIGRKVGSL